MKTYYVEFTIKQAWVGIKIESDKYMTTKQIRESLEKLGHKNVNILYIGGLIWNIKNLQ